MTTGQNNTESDSQDRITKLITECAGRIRGILDTQRAGYWTERMGVARSLVSFRWKKDSLPNILNLVKLLDLSGYSANWVLFGTGPQKMEDTHSTEDAAAEEKRRRQITEELFALESHLEETQAKLDNLEKYIRAHQQTDWMREILEADLLSRDAEEVKRLTGEKLFEQKILPIITMLLSMNHLGLKFLEITAKSDGGEEKMKAVFDFIKDHFNKTKFDTQSILANMDSVFEKKPFKE